MQAAATQKHAGYSYAVEKMFVSFVGNAPFNRDTIRAIEYTPIKFHDDEGEQQENTAIDVTSHKSSGPLSHALEQKGKEREVIVTLSIPKGSSREAYKAIQGIGKKFKLKTEKLSRYRKPETQQGKPPSRGRKKPFPFRGSDMTDLHRAAIKLAYENPGEIREKLMPVLARVTQRVPVMQYRPPKWIAAAVNDGKLDPKVLLIWKYVVDKLGLHYDDKRAYGAAIAYWRNKCKKEGIDLGGYATGGGGAGATSGFLVKGGDRIEDWVRARLKSEGLIDDVGVSAEQAEMGIDSLQRRIAETKAKIEKHRAGIAAGSRVSQREKWLAKAESELRALEGELGEAAEGVEKVREAAERHATHKAPTVAFEKEFQNLVKAAQKELSAQAITNKVLTALAQFNSELDAETSAARVAATHLGVAPYSPMIEDIGKALLKVWDKAKKLFGSVASWVKGLFTTAGKINRLMDKAAAA